MEENDDLFEKLRPELTKKDIVKIAKETGFLKRVPKKN